MIRTYVELSGESPALAEAEATSAAEALGGGGTVDGSPFVGLLAVELPGVEMVAPLAGRLSLARRCLLPFEEARELGELDRTLAREGAKGHSAAFRRVGSPTAGGRDRTVLEAGQAYKSAGGRIELEEPERRFWIARDREGRDHLLEEAAPVDRPATARRRMPLLPFQRPVSLPPRLARAAVNLARVRPGDRVLDPFLGTGAMLAEAGLIGARLYGIDRDATMVRGALQNLDHLGVHAEKLLVGDAGEVDFGPGVRAFDAIVTDPPYGRSSSTGGEDAERLVERVLPRWAELLSPAGRAVVVAPSGSSRLPPPWRTRYSVAIRVHRSLTREFRVYERAGLTTREAG